MANLGGKYAIVGVGETLVGKRPDATTHSLHLEAIRECLNDAGVGGASVDGFVTNQPLNDAHRSYAVRLAHMAGITPVYATDLALGGATPIAMVQHAVMAIEAGMATSVLCVHARKRSTGDSTPGFPIRRGTSTGSGPGGTSPPPRATPWRLSATCTNSAHAAKTWRRSPSPPAGTLP